MLKEISCVLCRSTAKHFFCFRAKNYYRCTNCHSVMMAYEDQLDSEMEKQRYDQHNNDPEDTGYRRFVTPLVYYITEKFSPGARGLDYGAGPGPVAAVMLGEKGYNVELYDPHYHPDEAPLSKKYDFIICSEVIEHFSDPAKEFSLLRSLLLPQGALFCLTELLTDDLVFEHWCYKNDPTHVFFYHYHSLLYIKSNYNFNKLTVDKRLICFDA
ncbi:MAG: class I SAM-dependent methyltransferase [Bacillota bacterium]